MQTATSMARGYVRCGFSTSVAMVEALSQPMHFHIQVRRPPRISTVEVVGWVTAWASAPTLNGARRTMAMNGADRARNNHSDVSETTFTPAMLSRAQAITTASPTHHPRLFT